MKTKEPKETRKARRKRKRSKSPVKCNRMEGVGNVDDNQEGGSSLRDTFTFVASSNITNNAELHYILTSIYDINLVERSLR